MRDFFKLMDQFFFTRISASGFGLMRIAWGFSTLAYLIAHFEDATFYFSDQGVLPNELGHLIFRQEYRFTVLHFVTEPSAVLLLYILYMLSVACVTVGLWPRATTIAAVFLMFSFHERNLLYLGGGETTLRNIGFILAISPGIEAFSLDRTFRHFAEWQRNRTLLPPLTMSIWPWRLLLWQFLVIYLTSLWDKLLGTMWVPGTAVASALHHTHFVRWPLPLYDLLAPLSPLFAWYTLLYEASWAMLLIPREATLRIPFLKCHSLKRWILAAGVLLHGMIYLLMDVGSFSLAMGTGFLGLLVQEDFDVFRRYCNKGARHPRIIVLYDGACRLCQRSVFVLLLCDHLRRLRTVDFRDASLRREIAPDVRFADLDRAMHIKLPRGNYEKGFDAFRVLTKHLPPLWPLAPFLRLPGMTGLGRAAYARIAANRNRCANGVCKHT